MKTLNQIQNIVIWGLIILLPITVLDSFSDPLGIPKLLLLAIGIAILIIIKAIQILQTGKLEVKIGYFDLGVVLVALAYLVSAILRTPNKQEAFFYPGTASVFVLSALLYFFINQAKNSKTIYALITSGVVLSILTLLSFLGLFEKIPQLPAFMKGNLFNFAGDYLTGALFLAAIVPFVIHKLIAIKDISLKLLTAGSLVIITLALALSIFNILPGKPTTPAIPDSFTSRVVALEALKENTLLGVGPANYLSAFNRFRPLQYNYTNLWPYRFSQGTNFYFTILTETGLIGIAATGVLILLVIKYLISNLNYFKDPQYFSHTVALVSLLIVLVILAFIPASFLIIITLFVLLAFNAKTKSLTFNLTAHESKSGSGKLPAVILALALFILVGFVGVRVRQALAAEISFKKAYEALARSDGKATYDLLQAAINQNPQVDRYHASYAQVNLAIARSLTLQNQDKELSVEDQQMLAQLVSQAIRESQTTVALNNERAENWEILARTYQIIMPLAKDAENYAIQAYNETIKLDPLNPNTRIALGGIYFAKGDWDNAIDTFKLATLAKPDFANAHYNLAAGYREKGEVPKAIEEMNLVLTLVPKDSQDFKLATTELENLKKKAPAAKATEDLQEGETLTPPQPQQPAINPQLELPTDANPTP